MSTEIDFDNLEPDFIPDCAGHGAYRGKCPHVGTRPVVEDQMGELKLDMYWLCDQCNALRKQDEKIERSETR
jgi:hypothetical protein